MPWERCFGRAIDGIRQEYQLTSKVPYSERHIKNHCRTLCFLLAYKVEWYLHQVLLIKFTHYE